PSFLYALPRATFCLLYAASVPVFHSFPTRRSSDLTFWIQLIIIIIVTVLFMLSAYTGLDKGIKILSNANMGLATILLLVTFTLGDRKSTRLNSSHVSISYAVFCLKKNIFTHNYYDF